VATHDSAGDLHGLSAQQLELLVQNSRTLTRRDDRVLGRRIKRDLRRLQNQPAAANVVTGHFTPQRILTGH
jgi:hypothetical protein